MFCRCLGGGGLAEPRMPFVFFGFENLPEIRISFFALESIVSIEVRKVDMCS